MDNINQIQTQAMQYINSVREGHQQLVRRYKKDYSAILDEAEISLRDFENVKGRVGDYKDIARLNQMFMPIQSRYSNRCQDLFTSFSHDINESCSNTERQVNSVLPSINDTQQSIFAPISFDDKSEDASPQFEAITNILRNSEQGLQMLVSKTKSSYVMANIITGIVAFIAFLIGLAIFVDLFEGFAFANGMFAALFWGGLTRVIIVKFSVPNKVKEYARSFINDFISKKENMLTNTEMTLKQYVNAVEKDRFGQLQTKIQTVGAPQPIFPNSTIPQLEV